MKQINIKKLKLQPIAWHKSEGGLVGGIRLPKGSTRAYLPIGFVDPAQKGFRAMLTISDGDSVSKIVKTQAAGKAFVRKALTKHITRQIQKINIYLERI